MKLDFKLESDELAVLNTLAKAGNKWMGYKALSMILGFSERRCRRTIKSLKEKKVVEYEVIRKNGRLDGSKYFISQDFLDSYEKMVYDKRQEKRKRDEEAKSFFLVRWFKKFVALLKAFFAHESEDDGTFPNV